MKKVILIITILAAAGFIFSGCKQNDTELGFINGTGSPNNINELVWADGDQTWSTPGGYSDGNDTGTKVVMQTSGTVDGKIDAGGGIFVDATIEFNIGGVPTSSLSLNDGESNVFTITAAY